MTLVNSWYVKDVIPLPLAKLIYLLKLVIFAMGDEGEENFSVLIWTDQLILFGVYPVHYSPVDQDSLTGDLMSKWSLLFSAASRVWIILLWMNK